MPPDTPTPVTPALWEQQPGEADKAFAAFVVYRDLGSRRSLDAVCRQLYRGTQTVRKRDATGRVQQWSATFRWVARARAWDEEKDRRGREAEIDAVRQMHRRHAEEATEFQRKALERLRQIPLEELDAPDVIRFYVEAVRVERTARGEPETVSEQRQKSDAHDRNTTHLILADPRAAALACELFERVAARPVQPGSPGLVCQPEEVADGTPPEPAQPQAR
jgi:hypothetical protein